MGLRMNGLLLLALLVVPMMVLAQDAPVENTAYFYENFANQVEMLREQNEKLCENAIIQYRAEAGLEIEKQKQQFVSDVAGMVRAQKFVALIGITVSAFLGTVLGMVVMESVKRKERGA